MNPPTLEALTQRLECVEKENRRLKLAAGIVLLICVGFLVMGQARVPSRVIEAERFILRGKNGQKRAELSEASGVVTLFLGGTDDKIGFALSVREDGSSSLRMFDNAGVPRITLLAPPNGVPGFGLSDDNGNARVVMEVTQSGTGRVVGYDQDGRPRAQLNVDRDGSPSLNLLDKGAGGGGVSAKVDPGGRSFVAVRGRKTGTVLMGVDEREDVTGMALVDGDGRIRLELEGTKDGRPGLRIFESDGTARAQILLFPQGLSTLALSDRAGRTHFTAGVTGEGDAALGLADKSGKLRWGVP